MKNKSNQRWKTFILAIIVSFSMITIFSRMKQENNTPVQETVESTQANLTNELITPTQKLNDDNQFHDSELGISFKTHKDWKFSEWRDEAEDTRAITFYDDKFQLVISSVSNSDNLTPKQWFDKNRHQFSGLFVEIAELDIQDYPALFIGVPDTCISVPGITVIISHNQEILLIQHFENNSRDHAAEIGLLLETLSFDDQKYRDQSILREYIQIPTAPRNVSCQ